MNKKGFTLIELLTVVAILGILVLLGTPKLLSHIEKADTIKIQTGIKSFETLIELNSIDNSDLTKDWSVIDSVDLNEMNKSGKIVDRKGRFVKEVLSEGSKLIPLKKTGDFDSIKWKGDGIFVLAEDNESVYYYKEKMNSQEEFTVNQDGSVTLKDGSVLPVSNDTEFVFIEDINGYSVSKKGVGYYKYIGNKSTVVIPMEIDEHSLTSYYMMFFGTSVNKVISYNKTIENISHMFSNTIGSSLDLTHLDTSNVTNMSGMFWLSEISSLNLSRLDTSNVINMYGMFYHSHANTLDLSNFDFSNVKNADFMFYNSHANMLDLSNFDFSNVTNMYSIVAGSKATIGYARTQKDADELNESLDKPESLKFVLKN